jgi:hypothetical protein
MKTYDYKKIKQLIEENKSEIISVSAGMHEDWFWTAETIWENGKYLHELPDNADELHEKFIEARNKGLSMFLKEKDENGLAKHNPDYGKYTTHQIAGLYGSSWATPCIEIKFKDGKEEMIDVSKGESEKERPFDFGLGCLSGPVQDNILPLRK